MNFHASTDNRLTEPALVMTWREKMSADADHALLLMPPPNEADK